jgi:Bacterial regulatory protein, Fis family
MIVVIPDGTGMHDAVRLFEKRFIQHVLKKHGSVSAAARAIGMNRTHLHDRMRIYGLRSPMRSPFARHLVRTLILSQLDQNHDDGSNPTHGEARYEQRSPDHVP